MYELKTVVTLYVLSR